MNVILASGWDESPTVDPLHRVWRHLARRREDEVVENFIRGKQGCLLVCGKRGVGKSSMVANAANTVGREMDLDNESYRFQTERGKNYLIPVFVNAPSFETYSKYYENDKSDSSKKNEIVDLKKIVLQNLIRRLHAETDQYEIADGLGITELNNSARAKEVTEQKMIQDMQRNEELIEKRTKINLKVTKKIILMIFFIGLGAAISLNPYAGEIVNSILAKVGLPAPLEDLLDGKKISYIISFLVAIIPFITITKSWDDSKTFEDLHEKKSSRSYMYEYNTSQMESEFEDALKSLVDPVYRIRKFERQTYEEEIKRQKRQKGTPLTTKLIKKIKKKTKGKFEERYEDIPSFSEYFDSPVDLVDALLIPLRFVIFPLITIHELLKRSRSEEVGNLAYLQLKASGRLKDSYKIVFVIDELDKLKEPDIIISVIDSLKTLLTRSSALFILIAGQDFYDLIKERIRTVKTTKEFSDVPAEYTLFNDILYIASADYKEIESFLDRTIIQPTPLSPEEYKSAFSEDSLAERTFYTTSPEGTFYKNSPDPVVMSPDEKREYDKFKRYLCFASKGSFFDAKKILSRRIHYEPNIWGSRNPTLDISLNEREKYQALLQTILLDQSQNAVTELETYENEYIRTILFDFLFRFSFLNSNNGDFFKIINRKKEEQILFNNSDTLTLNKNNKSCIISIIGYMVSRSIIIHTGDQYLPNIESLIL